MAPTRREFLIIAGWSAAGIVLPTPASSAPIHAGNPAAATPPSPAGPGPLPALKARRWAMAIEPKKCRPGCTDCVTACHQEHNVPDFGNPKDAVHWISLEKAERVFPVESHPHLPDAIRKPPLPVLCNHCDNPPCVRVCPTKATFRRTDGIVMMDYHRCIGCRFCMAACPYGSRSMNWRDPKPFLQKVNPGYPMRTRGVVEKCNFCEERLVRGLLPACVLACKEKAMAFGDLEEARSDVRLALDRGLSLRRRAELGTAPQIYYIL